MKVKIRIIAIMLCAALMLSASTSMAEVLDTRVTIGVDNTEAQIETIYSYFGIERTKAIELSVTNQEERKYLAGLVPDSKIGSVALSSVYIRVMDEGGIDLESHNINWVTDDMYISALATAGITDARVIVASAIPVSGTGALTGIYKAYEDITGEELDEDQKSVAVEELIITGDLQDAIGDVSSEIINDLKAQLEKTKSMTDEEIIQLIRDTAKKYETELTEEQIRQIFDLIKKLNELNIDVDSFIKIAQAGEDVKGFFESVGDFFKSIGDFFTNLFGG